MAIEWSAEAGEFHLRNDLISYVVRVLENDWLGHVYFGSALAEGKSYGHLIPQEFFGFSNRLGEPVPLEYPSGGSGDYRIPAVSIELSDGSGVLDLRYNGVIVDGERRGREPHGVGDGRAQFLERDA